MSKQVLVVGLGQFGMSLARALTERGVEVLAVDAREERVRVAATFAAEAVAFDATDESALARAAPERRDACVCAIGDEGRESAIVCTALLRQLGARRVIARSGDRVHARILGLVGAHEVVDPESAFGERLASRLVFERILDEIPLGKDLALAEIRVPPALAGRTLPDLRLPARFGVTVVAVRTEEGGAVVLPDPTAALPAGGVMVVVSRPGAVAAMLERL